MPRLFGITHKPELAADGQQLKPIEKFGVKVISIGFLVEEGSAVVWRGPMVMSALTQFLREVEWGELDVLVVDMPPGTGDAQLTMAQTRAAGRRGHRLDAAGSVADRRAARHDDVPAGQRAAARLDREHELFVCPHCGGRSDIFAHGGARHEAEAQGAPFLGEIPLDLRSARPRITARRSSSARRNRPQAGLSRALSLRAERPRRAALVIEWR